VVLALFNELRALPGLPWAVALPATEPDVDALLQKLATPLLQDHAARVLRDQIVQQINAIGSVSFGMARPVPPSGSHAPGQHQWLAALLHEATRLSQTCMTVAGLASLQGPSMTQQYNMLLNQYQHPTFLTSGDYLRDMGGHELLAALSRYLHALGAGSSFSQQFLADELLRLLAQMYQPNTLFQPDDFAELAAILAQY
jgi:hypothetical protein